MLCSVFMLLNKMLHKIRSFISSRSLHFAALVVNFIAFNIFSATCNWLNVAKKCMC